MRDHTRHDRRGMLRMLLAWAALGLAGLGAKTAGGARSASWEALGALWTDRESVSRLGAAFLRTRPEESDPRALRRHLGLPAGSVREAPPEVLGSLGASHREDFRRGRLCNLGGWTLSQTELRLCALLHLEEC